MDRNRELVELTRSARQAWSGDRPAWEEVRWQSQAAAELARFQESLIAAALAVDATRMSVADTWPEHVREAFDRLGYDERFGTGTLAGLHGLTERLSADQVAGLVNSAKGTVLELRVQEMAREGLLSGLDPRVVDARLAESLTQEGFDVELLDQSGSVVQQLQVKSGAWDNFQGDVDDYLSAGIEVAVTHDAAVAAAQAGYATGIIDTGVDYAELGAEVGEVVDNLGLGHAIDEFVPEFAIGLLVASAAVRIHSGEPTAVVRGWLTAELKAAGLANAAGVAVALLPGGAFARPFAAVGTRFALHRMHVGEEVAGFLRQMRTELEELRA